MPPDPSENTQVVATYPARHYAEMARDFLAENGIESFIVADDVHVPLQFTQGAPLRVMESRAPAAYEALKRAGLLPDSIAEDSTTRDDGAEE